MFIWSPRDCVPMAFTTESPPAQGHYSKPQGSSKRRVLPWPVTMDQSICVSLSHTHYSIIGMKRLKHVERDAHTSDGNVMEEEVGLVT